MNLRINLSTEEATSTAREYTVLPTGSYVCNIADIKTETVKNSTSSNFGKPYWNIKFIVDQDKPFEQYNGNAVFANVMLFEGAAYLIVQLIRAVFPENVQGNELVIPEPEAFLGKQVKITGVKFTAGSDIKKKGKVVDKRDRDQFEIKGFLPVAEGGTRPASNTGLLS